MPILLKFIKLFLFLMQVPLLLKANKKKRLSLKRVGMKSFKRRNFVILKKLYRFYSIGKAPIFNKTKDFKVGIYKGHKIGLFDYFSLSTRDSTVIIISMDNKLPKFLLRPQSLYYSLMRWFNKRKEVHIGHEAFSSAFVLLAKEQNKFQVATTFNFDVLDYFIKNNRLWVESDGYNLLIFKQKEVLFDGGQLDDMLNRAIDIKRILGAGAIGREIRDYAVDRAINKDLA